MSVFGISNTYNKDWNRTIGVPEIITDSDANEVIEYYQMFKAYQEGERKQLFNHTFNTASGVIENMLRKMDGLGFDIKDVYLRFDRATIMTVLLMVDEITLCSDKFDEAYNIAATLKEQSKSDIFEINFTFAATTENTIAADIAYQGFLLKKKSSKNEHS
jgi:hypothetical protein